MPYQHLHVWRRDVRFTYCRHLFFISENVSVSVRLVRYELWICVTWSFKIKAAVPVSTVETQEGVHGQSNKKVLYLKGCLLFLLNRRPILLHLFVFRYSTSSWGRTVYSSLLWFSKQNEPVQIGQGLITTCPETVECISMPYQVYLLLSSHCSSCQVICKQ